VTFDRIETYILSDGLDDWVMLGAVAEAAVAFGLAKSTLDARASLIGAVERLYSQRLIIVGEVLGDGKFHAWEGSAAKILGRLELLIAKDDIDEWYAAAWIDLTELGVITATALGGRYGLA